MDEKTLTTLERSRLALTQPLGSYSSDQAQRAAVSSRQSWWVPWESEDMPNNIEYVLQSWDTAFEAKESSSFSARTTWGVFKYQGVMCAIVLECWYDKVSYPDLRRIAQESYDLWEPDAVLIEKKAVWPVSLAGSPHGWRTCVGILT